MQQQPEPVKNADPMERFIDWLVDVTFEDVLKEINNQEKQTA